MTNNQFKKGINADLKAADMAEYSVKKVDVIGVNTVLYFDTVRMPINMRLLRWLNNRFQYGISTDRTDRTMVYINTPLQGKQDI